MLTADLVDEWPIVLMGVVLIAIAMVLTYRLMNRDPDVRRSRYGFFVERDRYTDEEPFWPNLPPKRHDALPSWPDRDKTVEQPPKEEK